VYLLTLTVIGFVSMTVALVLPVWRRPASVLAVALMAGNALAPDLAVGLRLLAAALTPALAVACVLRLRRPLTD
jgi:hypothetical protein